MTHPIEQLVRDAGERNPTVVERDARRRARVGRAQIIGAHLATSLALAELRDHGPVHMMPRGTAHLTAWTRGPLGPALLDLESAIEGRVPQGVVLTVEVRPAGLRHLAVAAARVALDVVARWWARRSG